MNSAQLHLALNHAPLFLSLLGGLLMLVSMVNKNKSLLTTGLFFLVAGGLITIPVFLTGEGTEELVEHLPGVSEAAMEKHEDMARITLIVIAVTGIMATGVLLLRRLPYFQRIGAFICLGLAFVSFGLMAQTAHLGGMIRHSEIRGSSLVADPGDASDDDDPPGKAGRSEDD